MNSEQQKRVKKNNQILMNKISDVVCGERESTAWKQVSTNYCRSNYTHVVITDLERLNLQMEGDMTGKSWIRFCVTLKRMK